jgi:hypothetical protein
MRRREGYFQGVQRDIDFKLLRWSGGILLSYLVEQK